MFIDALLHLPRVEKQKIKNMNNLASSDHYFGRHTLAYGREVWVRELVRLLCCVLGQNTFLSQCLSPTQEFIWEAKQNAREVGEGEGKKGVVT